MTDEAHYDNVAQCDFCLTAVGGDYDQDADFPQERVVYFQVGSTTICHECTETLFMHNERGRNYKEPAISWVGQFGNQEPQRIEDLRRCDLIDIVRHLHAQLTNEKMYHKQLKKAVRISGG